MTDAEGRSDAVWAAARAAADVIVELPVLSESGPSVELFLRRVPAAIPNGFRMGSRGVFPEEEPIHRILIEREYFLGTFAVTQEQWQAAYHAIDMSFWNPAIIPRGKQPRAVPSHFDAGTRNGRRPVDSVSWVDAIAFCEALSRIAEFTADRQAPPGYRYFCLPTESEWEHACRAGTEADYWNGDGQVALHGVGWNVHNSGHMTRCVDEPVDPDAPERHPFGLHGMHGNVWEWCHDEWSEQAYRLVADGDSDPGAIDRAQFLNALTSGGPTALALGVQLGTKGRVIRGGSWRSAARPCRAAFRVRGRPLIRSRFSGFRVCLVRHPPEIQLHGISRVPHSSWRLEKGNHGFVRVENLDSPQKVARFLGIARAGGPSQASVMKIVIGPSPGSDEDTLKKWQETGCAALSGIDWQSFPNLTHLYIWSIEGLTAVPSLPPRLECLDLRGCKNLQALPASLPDTLETLDLAGCAALEALPKTLPTSLAEIHLSGCGTLKFFAPVRGLLEETLDMRTVAAATGGGNKLPGLRRLVLHGCRFDDLDDASCGKSGENVAQMLLQKYAQEREQGTAVLAECKIVVVGDGGAGKTSLVRALKGLAFKPQAATDRIRCWTWDGGDEFRPYPNNRQIRARINIWDFAGQQLYHGTHRTFLESRAVFLVVWRTAPKDGSPNRPECPDDVTHDLNYWLDQIHAANRNPNVIIVRTRCDEDDDNPPDRKWATKLRQRYHHLVEKAAAPVSARDHRRATLAALRLKIQAAIRHELRTLQANLVPAGWRQVRETLGDMQSTWNDADDIAQPPRNHAPTLRLYEFQSVVEDVYRRSEYERPTVHELINMVSYLHDIGAVYCPRIWRDHWNDRPHYQLIVDQRWAIDAVYMLTTNPRVIESIRRNGGIVSRGELDRQWHMAREEQGQELQPRMPQARQVPETPAELWAIEQLMQSAGLMIEMPTGVDGRKRYAFPEQLSTLAEIRPTLAQIGFAAGDGQPHRFEVEGYDEFDASFAGRLMSRIKQSDTGAHLFRYGAVLHRTFHIAVGEKPANVIIVVEWVPPNASHEAKLTVTVEGAPEQIGRGVDRAVEDVLRPWIEEGVREQGADVRLSYSGVHEWHDSSGVDDGLGKLTMPPRTVQAESSLIVAISYAGNDDTAPSIEELPDLIGASVRELSMQQGVACRVLQYKDSTERHLPTLIRQVINGYVVVAVVSRKYVNSNYCMQEFFRCATRDDPSESDHGLTSPGLIGQYFPDAAQPPWSDHLWVVAIPSEKVHDLIPAVWAQEVKGRADAFVEEMRKGYAGRGNNALRQGVCRADGGDWILVLHDLDVDQISPILQSMRHDRVPAWNRLRSNAPMAERAERVAEEIVRRVKELHEHAKPVHRLADLKRRSLHFCRERKLDLAADDYEELVMLNPAAKDDPELEEARTAWVERRRRPPPS